MSLKYLKIIPVLITLQWCLPRVQLMSIMGSPKTRYTPCGLGLIYMDKVNSTTSDVHWHAVLDLPLYPQLAEADVNIEFEVSVASILLSDKALMHFKNEFNLRLIIEDLPRQFEFNIILKDPHAFPKINKLSLGNQTLCNEKVKVSQNFESFNITKNMSASVNVCGRRSMDHTELTTTGTFVGRGEWPWHVAVFVLKVDAKVASYECGGSVISTTAIVTAGHCLSKNKVLTEARRVIIFAGATDLRYLNDKDTQARRAVEIVLHPGYNDIDPTSDLAIVKVLPLTYSEYIQPICLWGSTFDKTQLFGKIGVVNGFGKTENNTFNSNLRSAQIMVQNDDICIAYSTVYTSLLNEFTFCAGYGPADGMTPNMGDSGGGITFPQIQSDHKMSWFLRGVLSKCVVLAASGFCDQHHYVVYTDIGPHYTWLMHHAGLQYLTKY